MSIQNQVNQTLEPFSCYLSKTLGSKQIAWLYSSQMTAAEMHCNFCLPKLKQTLHHFLYYLISTKIFLTVHTKTIKRLSPLPYDQNE